MRINLSRNIHGRSERRRQLRDEPVFRNNPSEILDNEIRPDTMINEILAKGIPGLSPPAGL